MEKKVLYWNGIQMFVSDWNLRNMPSTVTSLFLQHTGLTHIGDGNLLDFEVISSLCLCIQEILWCYSSGLFTKGYPPLEICHLFIHIASLISELLKSPMSNVPIVLIQHQLVWVSSSDQTRNMLTRAKTFLSKYIFIKVIGISESLHLETCYAWCSTLSNTILF